MPPEQLRYHLFTKWRSIVQGTRKVVEGDVTRYEIWAGGEMLSSLSIIKNPLGKGCGARGEG